MALPHCASPGKGVTSHANGFTNHVNGVRTIEDLKALRLSKCKTQNLEDYESLNEFYRTVDWSEVALGVCPGAVADTTLHLPSLTTAVGYSDVCLLQDGEDLDE